MGCGVTVSNPLFHRARLLACSVGVAMCLLLLPAQAMVVELTTTFEEPVSVYGGRTMMVEEITATWCPSCAEIDPQLEQVADSHGSRLALVALHPSDGEDAFQPEASQYRIDRLRRSNSDAGISSPTFLVEGGEERQGYDAWGEVKRDILDTELKRQNTSALSFEVVATAQGYRASVLDLDLGNQSSSQLTFMLLEHDKPMPEGAVNPGGSTRDRVLVGIAECTLNNDTISAVRGAINATSGTSCSSEFSFEFDSMESWSVILVHEDATSSIEPDQVLSTYGAIEMAHRDRGEETSTSPYGWALVLSCLVLATASIVRKK